MWSCTVCSVRCNAPAMIRLDSPRRMRVAAADGAEGAEQGQTEGVRDVRREAGDHSGLLPAEPERPVRAVQAEVPPAFRARDERGSQLVTEPGRSHDLAIPLAVAPGS